MAWRSTRSWLCPRSGTAAAVATSASVASARRERAMSSLISTFFLFTKAGAPPAVHVTLQIRDVPEPVAAQDAAGAPRARPVAAVDDERLAFLRWDFFEARPDLPERNVHCARHVAALELPLRAHVENDRRAPV